MPYYRNEDVICWVKVLIVESYEGALDEDQKKDIRNSWKELVQIEGGMSECFAYKWAWNMIAVPFGIEDTFPETFVDALHNSWIAAGESADDDPKDTSFSEELQELFDEDEDDEEDENK